MMTNMASEARGWHSMASLLGDQPDAAVAFLGVPLGERSLTPGRCDLGPAVLRKTLPRLSSYDLESGLDLGDLAVHDAGDLMLKVTSPLDAFEPVRKAVADLCARHDMSILAGGNNAITRPGVLGLAQGLGVPLDQVGLLTLDAHFDLRDTDCGLTNGNPVQALLDDGLPGKNIAQIGLQPFANTRRMHEKAKAAGIHVQSMGQILADGMGACLERALDHLERHVDVIYVDFDIDVIARHEAPGAPGARPGGLSAAAFFKAARQIARHKKVRAVDLTEFDPSLDISDITALVAARWLAEILAGVALRRVI
ncbi:agmatinase family protein [Iodidimonas muriae]|nr:agmatinase family protein [Iodidimonas muriae]